MKMPGRSLWVAGAFTMLEVRRWLVHPIFPKLSYPMIHEDFIQLMNDHCFAFL